MSDFLISLGKGLGAGDLVKLTQLPYAQRRPDGKGFDFPWGSLAVLEERFGKNIWVVSGTVVAWVGDLLTEVSESLLESLIRRCRSVHNGAGEGNGEAKSASSPSGLNGCFAVVIADDRGVALITDPMNYVQVYMATDDRGKVVSLGTHPDLVAKVGRQTSLDFSSIGEFLNAGTPLFPNTVYENVRELHPGSVYGVAGSSDGERMTRSVYWTPPDEIREGYDEAALGEELQEILLSIVRTRCRVNKAGVFLSGGIDSRLIMAAVPDAVECVGVTFSNHPNRETRIAERIAACYGREWVPLTRGPEYLADCLVDVIKLTGCEYEWTCGQVIGVAKDLEKLELDVVLEGTLFNDYFTAFCARDWKLQKRWGGILESRFQRNDWSYSDQISEFWRGNLSAEIVGLMCRRRQRTYDMFADARRGSVAEWMEIYPFTQDPTVGYWPAERRVLPVRLVAMDRKALDFSFRCPIELKLGGRLYTKVACQILGRGRCIPNANDGVRPGSGHWWRLAQRAARQLDRRWMRLLERFGRTAGVQTSWHDYQRYWRESSKLRALCGEYGPNLDEFDGILLGKRGRDLLASPDLHWEYGFRLLQLAVWRDVVRGYRV